MRDVMFYLEAQNKVGQSSMKDEIQQDGAQVVIGTPSNTPPAPNAGSSGENSKQNHRKKRSGRWNCDLHVIYLPNKYANLEAITKI